VRVVYGMYKASQSISDDAKDGMVNVGSIPTPSPINLFIGRWIFGLMIVGARGFSGAHFFSAHYQQSSTDKALTTNKLYYGFNSTTSSATIQLGKEW